jgi:murein DD-endopeptidase MepM/ murein hydrolase activator NlpD
MPEPGNYKRKALDWLTKFRSGLVVRKNEAQAKLHKLVQGIEERLAFKERSEKYSGRIAALAVAVSKKTAFLKEVVTARMAVAKCVLSRTASTSILWIRRYKKTLVPGVAALTLIAVVFAVTYKPIYAVHVDGEVVGYVHDVLELQESFDEVVAELEEEYEQDITPSQQIEFVRVRGEKVEVADVGTLKETLLDCVSLETQGHMLVIDDQEVLCVVSYEEAEQILEKIKEDYISKHKVKNTVIEKVEIEEEIEILKKDVPINAFIEPEEAVSYLLTGGVETQTYKVADGDSLWSVSKKFSISLEDLRTANPDIKGDKLSIGQQLSLEVVSPYLNIISTEKMTETVRIAFGEEVKRDANMWAWERRVAQRGQSGQKEVVYEVVRRNGKIIEKEVKSETVVQAPVPQIVVRGSKQDSGSRIVGTGRFLWPVQGRITSRYGSRSGGFHTGVDIAAPRNTPIRAADDGTVTVAVYSRVGYGNRVEVSHGNGFSTLYAHCNSLAVRQGQTVKKGQIIAYVGSTGRSSGDHLHFEIRINGNHVNPMRYF